MTQKPIILAVDDDNEWHDLWRNALGDKVTYLKATTVEEGFIIFEQYQDSIHLFIIDACVPGLTPTTIPLIQRIRKTFIGPIIGCSSSVLYREELIDAGCSHDVDKSDIARTVAQIFGFQL